MAIDRYTKDYRLIDSVDEHGRIHTEMEYIGKDYVFSNGIETAKTSGKKLGLCCLLSWIGFFAALSLPSKAGHVLYALLPCVVLVVPLWLLCTVAYAVFRLKEPFSHKEADLFTLRLPAAATFACILSFAAVLGCIGCLLFASGSVLQGDWFFLCGNLICFVCSILSRKQTVHFAVLSG